MNIPDSEVVPAQRHLAPPPVPSIGDGETHGQFETDASGRTRADLYGTLAARDGGHLCVAPRVLEEVGTERPRTSTGQQWIWYPPGDGFAVPYLPTRCRGVALSGLPVRRYAVIRPVYRRMAPDGPSGWSSRPAAGAPALPPVNEQDGPLTVHRPKASGHDRPAQLLVRAWLGRRLPAMGRWLTATGGVTPA